MKTDPPVASEPVSARLGPGRLVLVVGPSGAGKDTVIAGARKVAPGGVLFPRRVVTRPSSEAEDNIEASPQDFQTVDERGGFALVWRAHGHAYGIPVSIDGAILSGLTVVCNVSRTVLDTARDRYDVVTVVEITAPPGVLESRRARRARASDSSSGNRGERQFEAGADIVILNDTTPDAAVRQFVAVLGCEER